MPTTVVHEFFNDLFNTVVFLIYGKDGVTLIDVSDRLEKLVKQLVAEGYSSVELKKLLTHIEEAMRRNDMVLLLDVLYAFSKNQGVKIVV